MLSFKGTGMCRSISSPIFEWHMQQMQTVLSVFVRLREGCTVLSRTDDNMPK